MSDESKISEAEDLIEHAQSLHDKIQGEEKNDLPNEIEAVVEDVEKFKEGDLSEERLKRIIKEMSHEEEDMESVIRAEKEANDEELEALRDIRGVLGNIEKRENNERKMMKGFEQALGSLGDAQSFTKGLERAWGDIMKTAESIDKDVDEEAEIAKDLDVLGNEIQESVLEEEELLKDEKKDSQLLKVADKVLVNVGDKKGDEKVRELEKKDEEEYEQTLEELRETEEITELEENEVSKLYSELKQSAREIKRMIDDVKALREKLENSPGDRSERIRKLDEIEAKLESDLKEAEKAQSLLSDAADETREAESEESRAESAA